MSEISKALDELDRLRAENVRLRGLLMRSNAAMGNWFSNEFDGGGQFSVLTAEISECLGQRRSAIAVKVYVLQTGSYDERHIHSIHSNRADAEAVDAIVRRDWTGLSAGGAADIDEYQLDEPLCAECGYNEDLHIKNPKTITHAFRATP